MGVCLRSSTSSVSPPPRRRRLPTIRPTSGSPVRAGSWPVLVDESQGDGAAGVAATAYGATGWPYFVIVGADGKVKVRVSGEIEVNDLQQIVDDALAG